MDDTIPFQHGGIASTFTQLENVEPLPLPPLHFPFFFSFPLIGGLGGRLAMGQNPFPPVNIPIPTKIGSKMGGEFTYQPKWDPIGVDPRPRYKTTNGILGFPRLPPELWRAPSARRGGPRACGPGPPALGMGQNGTTRTVPFRESPVHCQHLEGHSPRTNKRWALLKRITRWNYQVLVHAGARVELFGLPQAPWK